VGYQRSGGIEKDVAEELFSCITFIIQAEASLEDLYFDITSYASIYTETTRPDLATRFPHRNIQQPYSRPEDTAARAKLAIRTHHTA
jgi:hypothetical protein